MNTKIKKVLLWGAVSVLGVAGTRFFFGLFGGFEGHERGGMGRGHGEFHTGMHGAHHSSDFSWLGMLLFLLIIGAAATFGLRWFKKKVELDTFEKFAADLPASNVSTPVNKSNADILDNWEKEQKSDKEGS